jgi:hypothetical protein
MEERNPRRRALVRACVRACADSRRIERRQALARLGRRSASPPEKRGSRASQRVFQIQSSARAAPLSHPPKIATQTSMIMATSLRRFAATPFLPLVASRTTSFPFATATAGSSSAFWSKNNNNNSNNGVSSTAVYVVLVVTLPRIAKSISWSGTICLPLCRSIVPKRITRWILHIMLLIFIFASFATVSKHVVRQLSLW